MDNQHCPTGGGDCKKGVMKCLIPVAAVFATIFVFEWIFHGVLLMPTYEATASLWRPMEEMQQMWPVCLVSKLIMAGVIACLYCSVAKGSASQGKCYHSGAKFGFKIGLLLGAFQFASYGWLPISFGLALAWLVGYTVMGILIGLVLAATCRMGKKGGMAA